MNEITIIGRLGKDPELSQVGSQNVSVCRFSVAVNRPKLKNEETAKTDWFECVAWRGVADYVAKFAKSGKKVAVHGAMQKEQYDKDGETQTKWKLQASKVEVLEYVKDEEVSSSTYDKREDEQMKLTPIADDNLPF